MPIASKAGPTTAWVYDANSGPVNPHVDGASYIKLPTTYPPSQTESNWMAAEGLLALVSGGEKWFKLGLVSLSFGGLNLGAGGSGNRRRRRGIVLATTGQIYVEAPPTWTYPQVVNVNGTDFSDGGKGNLFYTNAAGEVLNLETWGS